MIVYKLWLHIKAFFKKILYKIAYFRKLKIGKRVTWRNRFNVLLSRDAELIIGDDCFFNNDCSINVMNKVTIGNGSIFGENVKIYDHNHKFNDFDKSIKSQGFTIGEVVIGNHCWIGSGVIILKGSNIGDNCVISAGVVVNGAVPSGTIVRCKENTYERIRSK